MMAYEEQGRSRSTLSKYTRLPIILEFDTVDRWRWTGTNGGRGPVVVPLCTSQVPVDKEGHARGALKLGAEIWGHYRDSKWPPDVK